MGIFGGTTLELAANDPESYQTALQSLGPESIIYQVFGDLGHLKAFSIFFGIGMFISYVTAADSSTEAMASLSMKGKVDDEFQVNSGLKIFWGVLLGLISWVMINYSGIEGVRILSVIGGLPAFFFLSLASISLFILSLKPNKFL
jgi:choline-glycine betaine transporter